MKNRQHKMQGVHDKGIDTLAKELIEKQKYHILSIASNVLYEDYSRVPIVRGEIDLIALYNDGSLGLYEVKSNLSRTSYEKAQQQLQRMSEVFRSYRPELATYIAKERVIIPYTPLKKGRSDV